MDPVDGDTDNDGRLKKNKGENKRQEGMGIRIKKEGQISLSSYQVVFYFKEEIRHGFLLLFV